MTTLGEAVKGVMHRSPDVIKRVLWHQVLVLSCSEWSSLPSPDPGGNIKMHQYCWRSPSSHAPLDLQGYSTAIGCLCNSESLLFCPKESTIPNNTSASGTGFSAALPEYFSTSFTTKGRARHELAPHTNAPSSKHSDFTVLSTAGSCSITVQTPSARLLGGKLCVRPNVSSSPSGL